MKIIVADDHAMIRAGLADLLNDAFTDATVVEAEDLPSMEAVCETCDDVVLAITDLFMPGTNGLVGIVGFMQRHPSVAVLIYSGASDDHDIELARQAGVRGYISKNQSPSEITLAVAAVLRGDAVTEEIFGATQITNDNASPTVRKRSNAHHSFETLTPREKEVMFSVVKGSSNKEVAIQLGLQEITVKVHLKSIFTKLGVTSRTKLITHVLELGWHLHQT